jgi:2-polyprenyl-3-methyl-5-hydroxy-6-metoxy-1,4-benzoquinol methylase
MTRAPKLVVAQGYDVVAGTYLERLGQSVVRDRWLRELIARLPDAARVLDLGCGAGVPVAHRLAERGFEVVGIDGSIEQIRLARRNVPQAEFIHADMTAVALLPRSFDAVAAFYSITHVPREEHTTLLRRIADWLKPDGLFIASLGSGECADWVGEWLGTEMFFSHYDASTYEGLVRAAGFNIEIAEVVDQDNEDARFLWVIARRQA